MEALENLVRTAKEAGVPRDQVQSFLQKGYIPLPWQWTFHATARLADSPDGPVDIGLGGARGPGKSHGVLSQAALDDCQRVNGLKGLFLRQTGKAAQESFTDLVEKVVVGKVPYKKSGSVLHFPNTNSKIVLGGFEDENDIDKYIGIEYDFMIVEELNQLSENKYMKLRGSLRTSKTDWRPRMYTSFNPGGIGHGFVKERYVTPHRLRQEAETRFIPSTYKANKHLNKEYIDYLESLPGDLGKAWREGEFDLFAGQFFKEWRYAHHVVAPFTIPDEWYRWMAFDWGVNHPFSVGWYASNPDGRVYKYRELSMNGDGFYETFGSYMTPKTLARIIRSINKKHKESPSYMVSDTQIFNQAYFGKGAKALEEGDSIAEVMAKEGVPVTRADKDRINGWARMRGWLAPAPDGLPWFQVFETCPKTIKSISELIFDDIRPEDAKKNEGDDCADETRYSLMSRPPITRIEETIESPIRRAYEQAQRRNHNYYNEFLAD